MDQNYFSSYRLMHALFHIRTVVIPRNRYRLEGFIPKKNRQHNGQKKVQKDKQRHVAS
jgi:hypothetical protein